MGQQSVKPLEVQSVIQLLQQLGTDIIPAEQNTQVISAVEVTTQKLPMINRLEYTTSAKQWNKPCAHKSSNQLILNT